MCRQENKEHLILVVDDEPMNIRMAERIFRDVPAISIKGASGRDEALSALADNNIDLILLDLKMPDIDGFGLYEIIRRKYSVPVIIMTADESSEVRQKISELGIGGFLTKPLNKPAAMEMVSSILSKT